MIPYIEGDPRFTHVRRDTLSLIYAWAQKEFKNLQRAKDARVNVPEPLAVEKNVLIMKFIGKDGVRAPLMKETFLEDPEKILELLQNRFHKTQNFSYEEKQKAYKYLSYRGFDSALIRKAVHEKS